MNRYGLHPCYLPTRPPVLSTLVLWLILDRFGVYGFWLNVIWFVWGLYFLGTTGMCFMQTWVTPRELVEVDDG